MTKFLPFIWVAIVALILMLGYAKNRLSKLEKKKQPCTKRVKRAKARKRKDIKK